MDGLNDKRTEQNLHIPSFDDRTAVGASKAQAMTVKTESFMMMMMMNTI